MAPERRRTRLIRREHNAEQLDTLTRCCRREAVTVHSALTAAMAIAVADMDADPAAMTVDTGSSWKPNSSRGSRRQTVSIGAPVDFRAELVPAVGPRDAGAYVATVPSHLRVGPAIDLWTAARAAFRDLRCRTRFHQHLALVWMLRFLSPRSVATSARAVAMVERIGPGNVCLSNIEFPDRVGRWELSGAQFIACISISGYLVATVNTSHAALHWNFTYIDGAVTEQRAEQIADRAVQTLLSSLRHTPIGTGTRRRSWRQPIGTRTKGRSWEAN